MNSPLYFPACFHACILLSKLADVSQSVLDECERVHLGEIGLTLPELTTLLLNCEQDTVDRLIDPDPDIAGRGVLLAFTLVDITLMVLGAVNSLRLFIRSLEPGTPWWREFFPCLPGVRRGEWLWKFLLDRRRFRSAIREVQDEYTHMSSSAELEETGLLTAMIIALADVQFFMGLAIGAAALAKKNISSYHWQMCTAMAQSSLVVAGYGLRSIPRWTYRTNFSSSSLPSPICHPTSLIHF